VKLDMKILFITAGEVLQSEDARPTHKFDLHLSDTGAQQALNLAPVFVQKKIQLLYHSPQMSAVETSKLISKKLLLPLKMVENLAQMNARDSLVDLAFLKANQYAVKEQAAEDIVAQPSLKQITEDYELFKLRVANAFAEVLSVTKYHSVAIVTHEDFLKCLVKEYLKIGDIDFQTAGAFLEIHIEHDQLTVEDMHGLRINRLA
jgi:broad specificity phosphatase PhoE